MVSVPEISKNIVKLFSIEKKRELEKYCSHLLIASEELVDLIQSSWLIGYVHSSRHKEYQPPEAQLTEDDLEALRSKDPAIRAQKLPKLMNKTDNLFNVRKRLSAHLFLNTSMKWHLFYFSIEDVADCRDNHWKKGGPHVHFINYLWPQYQLEQLDDLLFSERKVKVTGEHIRFKPMQKGIDFNET
jgi:hypothetical protein